MTVGELILNNIDKCVQNAIKFAEKNDWNMATFWKNASIGLKKKIENMPISELEKSVATAYPKKAKL